MACCNDPPLLAELQDLVGQIGSGGCCDKGPSCCPSPCCCPCNFPYVHVTMTVPPPILAPIRPEPVKPLSLPCPPQPSNEMSTEQRELLRYDNFYNNYNIDWHDKDEGVGPLTCQTYPNKQCGVTLDGQTPCCNIPRKDCCPLPGCPTGFKPCTMKLRPPPCCHPMLPWCAEIQPCPPGSKKKKKKCGGH